MRAFSVGFAVLLVALFSINTFAVDPTTKPTTQPSAKPPIPKAWLTIENKANHFKYRVPPQWTKAQSSDTVTVLDLPKPSAPPRGPGDIRVGRFIAISGPCHAVTVEDDAKAFRASLPKDHPGAKIVKDEATELGGRPAWLFVYDSPVSVMVTTSRNGGPPINSEIKKSVRTYEINTVQGKTLYYISFEGDTGTYTSALPTAQRVFDSLEWTN